MRDSYRKNKWIRNNRLVDLYLWSLRGNHKVTARACALLLRCDIQCTIPEKLFLPHPFGIVVGEPSRLANEVVLLQHTTLGGKGAYFNEDVPETNYPTLEEGVYVGPGAAILGRVTIGRWSVIGANAVVTQDVPPFSIVVGHNRILSKKSTEL